MHRWCCICTQITWAHDIQNRCSIWLPTARFPLNLAGLHQMNSRAFLSGSSILFRDPAPWELRNSMVFELNQKRSSSDNAYLLKILKKLSFFHFTFHSQMRGLFFNSIHRCWEADNQFLPPVQFKMSLQNFNLSGKLDWHWLATYLDKSEW